MSEALDHEPIVDELEPVGFVREQIVGELVPEDSAREQILDGLGAESPGLD